MEWVRRVKFPNMVQAAVPMLIAAAFFVLPASAAQEDLSLPEARSRLADIYGQRGDLKSLFRAHDWAAIPCDRTVGIGDLEDWARQYGHKEYPGLLAYYSPDHVFVPARLVVSGGSSGDHVLTEARASLADIRSERGDLMMLFRADDWLAVTDRRTAGISDLEDWASQYGHKEYPERLEYYSPDFRLVPARREVVRTLPPVLEPVPNTTVPVRRTSGSFNFGAITAESVFVIDPVSNTIVLAKNEYEPRVMASITKLMTALVALDHGIDMSRVETLLEEDEPKVSGAVKLRVAPGTRLTVKDLFYATLVGSANNTAHALARTTGMPMGNFIDMMNTKAEDLGLKNTSFVDPAGLEVDNISTAVDIAALAKTAFDNKTIQEAVSTISYTLYANGKERKIKNTNGLLTDLYNGLIVLGGKTGYLIESKWNLVVKMKDSRQKPLIVVTLGSDTPADSFRDSATIANWVWDNYRWVE